VLDPPASNIHGFLWRDIFLQISRIGLFGTKRAFLHLENYDWQEDFLSKTTYILIGKQCADVPASNMDGFL
jgi:hypothetical protein